MKNTEITAQDAELLRDAASKLNELVVAQTLVLALLKSSPDEEVLEDHRETRKLASRLRTLATRLLPPGTLCKLGDTDG